MKTYTSKDGVVKPLLEVSVDTIFAESTDGKDVYCAYLYDKDGEVVDI